MKLIASSLVLILACIGPCTADSRPNVVPPKGYIPDEQTAVRVALAILEPVYGRELLQREKPFHATLKDGVWLVEGTLKNDYAGIQSGGTAEIELEQKSGRVIRMIHGK